MLLVNDFATHERLPLAAPLDLVHRSQGAADGAEQSDVVVAEATWRVEEGKEPHHEPVGDDGQDQKVLRRQQRWR